MGSDGAWFTAVADVKKGSGTFIANFIEFGVYTNATL